jgi:hypothetical protein
MIPIEKYLEELNEPIVLSKLNRPFSIELKQLELNKYYNSAYDDKKENLLHLSIKIQIYIGSEPFSKARYIKWRGLKSDQNPLFNRKICFNLQYHNLPMFSSILFKISYVKYGKNNEITCNNIIGWSNFRLFDHNRKLKTGKLNFLSRVCIRLVYGTALFQMIHIIVGLIILLTMRII